MLLHSDRRATPQWGQFRPPLRGRVRRGAGGVAMLAGATSPCRAPLLSRVPFDAITMAPTAKERL